jgi:exopolysaccharide biosynthesis polyprenyl glycosylphosphotransferase
MPIRHQTRSTAPKIPLLRPDRQTLTAVQVAVDLVAILLAFISGYLLYTVLIVTGSWYNTLPDSTPYLRLAAVFSAITLLAFWHLGLYRARSTVLNLWELQAVPQGIALAAAFFFALLFFLKVEGYSRVVIVGAIAVTPPLLILERRMIAALTRYLKLRGVVGSRVLIYGSGPLGQLLMKKIVQGPALCRTVIGFVDDAEPLGRVISCRLVQDGSMLFQAAVLGHSRDLREIIARNEVDELLVVMPALDGTHLSEILDLCTLTGTTVGVVPQLGELRADRLAIEDLSAIPVLRPQAATRSSLYLTAKRAMDLVLSAVMMIVVSPFTAVAALLIRLDSPGPVLFIQERVGLNGRRFRMFKFRTMRMGTDPYAPSPSRDMHQDITRVGRVLRIGGMDELPQLINVLRGEMSLVGPRPEMPFIVEGYGPLERERLTVKPGITGVWQLSADRHSQIHENLEYDLYYVSHASIMLDLVILVETVLFTLGLIFGGLRRRRQTPAVRVQAEATNGRKSRLQPNRISQPIAASTPRRERSHEPYVLVALDQRRNGTVPASWRTTIPAVQALSSCCGVKTLVAISNLEMFNKLSNEGPGLGSNGHQTECVFYQTPTELHEVTSEATVVVTDLEQVIAIARETGVDTVAVDGTGYRWVTRSRHRDPVIDAVASIFALSSETSATVVSAR